MYKIIGANQQEYGPVSADQLRLWIAEGRVDANTQAQAEGAGDWKPLRNFAELADLFAQTPPAFPTPPSAPQAPGVFQPTAFTPGYQAPSLNAMALTGFIIGVTSVLIGWICCLAWVLSPLGITFSVIGLTQINRNPQGQTGKGLAIAGLILSILGILLTLGLFFLGFSKGFAQALQNQ